RNTPRSDVPAASAGSQKRAQERIIRTIRTAARPYGPVRMVRRPSDHSDRKAHTHLRCVCFLSPNGRGGGGREKRKETSLLLNPCEEEAAEGRPLGRMSKPGGDVPGGSASTSWRVSHEQPGSTLPVLRQVQGRSPARRPVRLPRVGPSHREVVQRHPPGHRRRAGVPRRGGSSASASEPERLLAGTLPALPLSRNQLPLVSVCR